MTNECDICLKNIIENELSLAAKSDLKDRINRALKIAFRFGGRAWIIDQIVRKLIPGTYEEWVRRWESGTSGAPGRTDLHRRDNK